MRTRRRGIGTVIASAIMIFLMLFTISQLYVYAIEEQDNYNRVAMQVFNVNAQKQNERLVIQNAQLNLNGPDTVVSLTVADTGGTTSHVIAVWLDDIDSSTLPHVRAPVDVYIGAGRTGTLSGLATDIPSASNDKVRATVETQLGNSVSIELIPPALEGTTQDTLATTSLTLIPPSVVTGNVVVASLSVTNNNNLGAAFTSLAPDICVVIGSTPGQNCHKAAGNNLCNPQSGTTTSSPASCVGPAGNAASPPGFAFLPPGGTITFTWVFSVAAIIPDTPLTFTASYVNITAAGLLPSQMPSATAIIRGPGGASSTTGGNFQTAFGDIVSFFSSFQYSQDGLHWQSGAVVPGGKPTLFRVDVTNLGSRSIALNSTSEIILTGISSLSTTAPGHLTDYTKEFYIIQACPTSCLSVNAYPAYPVRTTIAPGATVTLYFGATTAGAASTDNSPNSGVNALVILSLVGNTISSGNPPYAQASIVLVTRST